MNWPGSHWKLTGSSKALSQAQDSGVRAAHTASSVEQRCLACRVDTRRAYNQDRVSRDNQLISAVSLQ